MYKLCEICGNHEQMVPSVEDMNIHDITFYVHKDFLHFADSDCLTLTDCHVVCRYGVVRTVGQTAGGTEV